MLDSLVQVEKIFIPVDKKGVNLIAILEPTDWRKPIIDYLRNPNELVEKKIRYRAMGYVILGDTLFKKSVDGNLLTCSDESKVYVALGEVHEGICGAYQAGEKMKWVLCRQRVYWPTMAKDCVEYAKSCEECQKHGNLQRLHVAKLYTTVKP